MKVILTAFFLAASTTFACGQQEAQFIGNVINQSKIQSGSSTSCTFEITYSMFNYSMVCPLDEGEVYGVKFEDAACSLKNGDQVSGILIKKDGAVYIE